MSKIEGISPVGTAAWTDGLYEKSVPQGVRGGGNPKFRTVVVYDKTDAEAMAFWQKYHDAHFANDGTKRNCPAKDGDEMTREVDGKTEANEFMAGKVQIQAKTHKAFDIVDGLGKPLPRGIKVENGDQVRFSFTENPMEGGEGFYLYLEGVQLVEKRARTAPKFDAVEGGFDASTVDAEDYATEDAGGNAADGDY